MALSESERHDVIFFLGWPGRTIVSGSTDYSKIIADRLLNLPTYVESRVRTLLGTISDLDVKLDKASCRLSAKQVGDIILRDDELQMLRKERTMKLKELSRLLDIEYLGGSSNLAVCI